jgi:hypothetical protein
MKAKLKKDINGEYFLEGFIRDIPRQINVYQQISETKARFGFGEHTGKLSKQNCDEIFGVVDVEMLAEARHPNEVGYAVSDSNFRIGELQDAYIEGFNKAMELNKDKVFTKQDMFDLYAHIVKNGIISGVEANEYIKSLQQPTEIEVEIVTEKVVDETKVIGGVKGVKGSGHKITTYKSIPKLDSSGNLILKKI